ncbi:MAG: polynucleotide adenylyltransferase PcnB [Gammaproteobacteria bacterium]|nr:polynucleotide adenylyltransferase PcnB [Gammaproteobacteria bacterium]
MSNHHESQLIPPSSHPAAVIIPRDRHPISRKNISDNAVKVLYRLHKAGFAAFLVGGGVRDLLLERSPKDFDVATDASPEQVRKLFGNCRLIGRRFRLAHVIYGRDIIEVATFRGSHDPETQITSDKGMLLRDNVYGTVEEDAWRRDFRVNALYYNIADFSLVDFTGGMADIAQRQLNVIGDPEIRFAEDPVRMLRAIRFAAKLGFTIDQESERVILEQGHLLREISPARLYDEMLKLFLNGSGLATFELLRRYDLFQTLFPEVEALLKSGKDPLLLPLLTAAFRNSDQRIASGKAVTPAFLHAALLWGLLQQEMAHSASRFSSPIMAMEKLGERVTVRQQHHTSVPRRFVYQAREIWTMQLRLLRRQGRGALQLLEHRRFRAAYDFLLLRVESGEPLQELAQWWTDIQEKSEAERHEMTAVTPGGGKKREGGAVRTPRKRKRRRSSANKEGAGGSPEVVVAQDGG